MKGIIMSLEKDIENQITNPPVKRTGSPITELKSEVLNLQEIVKTLASEIDKLNSKFKRFTG
jgi:hypothetical protein